MAILMDGKALAEKMRAQFSQKTLAFKEKYGFVPGLAVIIVGDDSASKVYVRNKKIACEKVGFYSIVYEMPKETSESEVISLIEKLNLDKEIHGILVQLPLPAHIDKEKVIKAISPKKDVDAFTLENTGRISVGNPYFLPCTPAGIMELLKEYNINPEGKNCTVIGRSNIVGKPMAMLLLAANGTVTVCHSKTQDLADITKNADIIVCTVGRAHFLTADMVKEGAVVVDVGMNRDENGKLCGDVCFNEVEKKASYITPVPGGVGPMTITMLLENTLRAAYLSMKIHNTRL